VPININLWIATLAALREKNENQAAACRPTRRETIAPCETKDVYVIAPFCRSFKGY